MVISGKLGYPLCITAHLNSKMRVWAGRYQLRKLKYNLMAETICPRAHLHRKQELDLI